MNFDLSDDQRTIKSTAREFLAARYPLAEVRRLALEEERGFTDAQWSEMVELGWPEIAELGTVEMVVVAEELGYALAPTPLQSTSTCTRPNTKCASVTGAWCMTSFTAPCTALWAMCGRKISLPVP